MDDLKQFVYPRTDDYMLKDFKSDYYKAQAPDRSCFFCKHCTDVFYDWDGPYAFSCDCFEESDTDKGILVSQFGLAVNCVKFEPDDEEEPNEQKIDSIGIYDVIEECKNATVQILRNSITGEESIGWFNNDDPPVTID